MTINRKNHPCDVGNDCYVEIGAGLEGNMEPVDLIDEVLDLVVESAIERDCDALADRWQLGFVDFGLHGFLLWRHAVLCFLENRS